MHADAEKKIALIASAIAAAADGIEKANQMTSSTSAIQVLDSNISTARELLRYALEVGK